MTRSFDDHPPDKPPCTIPDLTASCDVEEITRFARLSPRDHVLVLGRDSLAIALKLWRLGFVHVGCAPKCALKVAHGETDALMIGAENSEDLAAAVIRSGNLLRPGGQLMVRVARKGSKAILPALKAQLARAGFKAGPGLFDPESLWIIAERLASKAPRALAA